MEPAQPSSSERRQVSQSLAWVGGVSVVLGVANVASMGVILALWISPEEYGVAALALAAFPILDLATEMGLVSAIIQQGDHDPAKLSTIFWLNMGATIIIVLVLTLVVAPLLAELYEAPIVGAMLQVYGIKLLLQNVHAVPYGLMSRDLRFKELSLIRMIATFVEIAVRLVVAASSLGIWCFVVAAIVRTFVWALGVQTLHRWVPRLVFRWQAARAAVHFGFKTLLSRLLYYVYTGLDYYVVGYYFGKQSLGLYKAACDLGLDPAGVLSQIVATVAFPTFARLSGRPELLAQQFLQFARINLMIVGGYICLVVVPAPELLALLDPQWVAASGALRILGLTVVLRALSLVIPPLLDGVGRPSLTLTYMVVASVMMPLCFLGGAVFYGDAVGYESVAWSWFFGYPVAFAVLLGFGLRHARLSLRVYALAMGRIVLWLGLALLCGVAARTATTGLAAPLLRAAIVMATTATVLLLALRFGEGITPRGIVASVKQGPAEDGEQT